MTAESDTLSVLHHDYAQHELSIVPSYYIIGKKLP